MKKKMRYVPVVLCLALAAFFGTLGVAKGAADGKETETTIPNRVYFGSIAGGGLTEEEATAQIQAYVDSLGATTVVLSAGDRQVETTAENLGLSWRNTGIVKEAAGFGRTGNLIQRYKDKKDLEHEDKVYPIAYTLDRERVTAVLTEQQTQLETAAVDAGLTKENGTFTVVEGHEGVALNLEESVDLLISYFESEWQGETAVTVALSAEVTEPRGGAEELSQVKDLLGSFDTSYATSAAGRCANVARGAELVNGTVLYPGDTFSMYETCSPFEAENGYELAGAYENGTTVSSYGGGICQVSTTLYNAVIRAELEITERYPHSMTVGYVDPSGDAAIASTYKDLKFTNNTDAPIYIEGYTKNKVIYFNVYGHETRAANRTVSFVSETLESTEPETEFRATAAPIGTVSRVQGSHKGLKAQLLKIVTIDGQETSREVFNTSTYKASSAIYEVGTASSNAEAVAAINAAIATKDLAAIQAAAAAWSDEAIAAGQTQTGTEAADTAQPAAESQTGNTAQ